MKVKMGLLTGAAGFVGTLYRGALYAGAICLIGYCAATGPAYAAGKSFDVETFSPWRGYAMPNGLWLPGDIDGDGMADLVHVVQGADYVHTWRSKGKGTFKVGTFRPWRGYAMPNGLWLPGDFNGDGKSDLVHVVNATDYVHSWLSRGDGTFKVGTFRPWAGYAMPNGLWLTGDFNGDGKTDLLHVVNRTDYVHVWLSRGDGTFKVGTFRPWQGYAMPNGIWLAGDFNGDGQTDVVHVVNRTDYVHVWTSRGDGTFKVGTFRPWNGYAMPNGLWRTGDLDGDGRTDLVHVVKNTDYVHTWRSRGDGTFKVGTFRPWAGYAMPNGRWLSGDFNGDGLDDLVHAVRKTDYIHTWLSRGNGTYTLGTFSPWRGYAIPNGLWRALDFTGDGKTDIMHVVNRTDYVHPWISVLPGPGELSLDGLEVTQTIQDMDHSVSLLANKQTVVRAYLSAQVSSPLSVRGRLTITRISPPGISVTLNPLNSVTIDPSQNDQIRPKREDIAGSLNFRVPANLDNASTIRVTLSGVTNAVSGTPLNCSNCGISPRNVTLINTAMLRVTIIGLRYTTGTPPTSYAPSNLDFQLIQSWLRRAYPTANVIYNTRTVNATNSWPFSCGQANAEVAAIRTLDVAGGTDARTHYYGLVADGGGFMRGCAAVPGSANPAAIGSGPTGGGTWGWDTDGSYGDWYTAHELGHTFGRRHVGGTCGATGIDANYPFPDGQLSDADGAFVGFDNGDPTAGIAMAALPGVVWHDVMSYCDRQWVSSYTYAGIRTRLNAEASLGPGAEPSSELLAGAPAPAVEASGAAAGALLAEPSMTSAPELAEGAAAPSASIMGRPQAPGVPVPSMHLQKVPPPGMAEGFTLPEPALSGPPPIQRGSEPSVLQPGPAPSMYAEPVVAQPTAIGARVEAGDFINVIALVNVTRNTAEITSVNRITNAMVPGAAPSDRARVRLVDTTGNMIGDYPVEVMQNTDIEPGEDVTGLINAVIPFATNVGRLELLMSGEIVDVRQVSRNAPKVEDLSLPSAGVAAAMGAQPPGGGFFITWGASDPDGEELSFSVQVSGDDGATWGTIAVGLTKPELTISPEQIANMTSVKIRVIASDGFNSSVVSSETIQGPQQ